MEAALSRRSASRAMPADAIFTRGDVVELRPMSQDGGRGSLSGAPRGSRWQWWLACLATLLAQYPLLLALPTLFGPRAVLLGDGYWHAMAARSMAEGLPHGWIDATDGGFPLGPYYPIGGWLLASLFIRVGCAAATAVQLLGAAGTLAS